MNDLNKLIKKAKQRDKKAILVLLKHFDPLLKRQAHLFSQMELEFEDVYQQAALLFILGIYQYREIPPVTFSGYIKNRIKWGLWTYWRKQKQYIV